MKRIILFLIIVLLLSGCSLIPQKNAPKLNKSGQIQVQENQIANKEQTKQEIKCVGSNENVNIDISKIDTDSWNDITLFNKINLKVPADWYDKKVNNNDEEITFGSGISSFLTIRHKKGQNVIKERLDYYKEIVSRCKKETIIINNKNFIRYDSGINIQNIKTHQMGFYEYILQFDDDIFLFAYNPSVFGERNEKVAAIIDTVQKN